MSKYRGKYPHKIKEVWTDLGICYVRTNCGVTYQITKAEQKIVNGISVTNLGLLGMDVYSSKGYEFKPRFAKGL